MWLHIRALNVGIALVPVYVKTEVIPLTAVITAA